MTMSANMHIHEDEEFNVWLGDRDTNHVSIESNHNQVSLFFDTKEQARKVADAIHKLVNRNFD